MKICVLLNRKTMKEDQRKQDVEPAGKKVLSDTKPLKKGQQILND